MKLVMASMPLVMQTVMGVLSTSGNAVDAGVARYVWMYQISATLTQWHNVTELVLI